MVESIRWTSPPAPGPHAIIFQKQKSLGRFLCLQLKVILFLTACPKREQATVQMQLDVCFQLTWARTAIRSSSALLSSSCLFVAPFHSWSCVGTYIWVLCIWNDQGTDRTEKLHVHQKDVNFLSSLTQCLKRSNLVCSVVSSFPLWSKICYDFFPP